MEGHGRWPRARDARRAIADTTLTEQLSAPLRRAHPPAPARARRAAAVGARMRAPPCGQPVHRRRGLRPAARARPGRGAQAARLLRARERAAAPRAERGARAARAPSGAPRAPAAGQRDLADPRHVPAARRAADAGPRHAAGRLARPAAARRRAAQGDAAARSSARCRCSTATRPASRACAGAVAKLADSASTRRRAQIVTTIGATHALDIVTRTLLRAGDSVLVDEPGWSVEYARLAALGMRVLPVPRGDDGPDLDAMQRLIDAQKPHERPRLYVTCRCCTTRPARRCRCRRAHRVLQLAQAHDLHIVEDDTYAHLAPRAPAAPGRARRARAHDLRLGLLEDPGAELARRLPRGARRAGRAAASTRSCCRR